MTQQEALSFLLTHLVVEKNITLKIDQISLFNLMTVAGEAQQIVKDKEGVIPHEIIESLAGEYIKQFNLSPE